MAARLAWVLALLALGCARGPALELPEPELPPAPGRPAPPCAQRAAPAPEPSAEARDRAIPSSGTPPAYCEVARTQRAPTDCPATREDALLAIDRALVQLPAQRDQALAELEACRAAESAAVRALRAELAPRACRDLVAGPTAEDASDPEVASLLRALTIEARLERATAGRPDVPFDGFERYVDHELDPWLDERSRLVDELAEAGPSGGAGRRLVRLAHGRALSAMAAAARDAIGQVPACAPARYGRHGRITAARCPIRLEGPGAAGERVRQRADELEARAVAELRRGLDDEHDDTAIDIERAREAIAISSRGTGRSAYEPDAIPAPVLPAGTPPGVSTRLQRRLPPLLVPILLGKEPQPRPAPAPRPLNCAGPGLARPRRGALIHAHQ